MKNQYNISSIVIMNKSKRRKFILFTLFFFVVSISASYMSAETEESISRVWSSVSEMAKFFTGLAFFFLIFDWVFIRPMSKKTNNN